MSGRHSVSDNDPYSSNGDHIFGLLDDGSTHRILHVRVASASTLLKKDIFGLSDPYCKVALCSELSSANDDQVLGIPAETKPIMKTLNPSWNADFKFRVNPSRQYILFQVYDFNKLTADDFLGLVRFNLFQLPVNNAPVTLDDAPVHNLTLKPRSRRSRVRGMLHVQFMYEPTPDAESIHSAQQLDEDVELQDGQWESLEGQGLPEGWEERVDFSGRIVYVDHINRVVSLDRPTAPVTTGHRGSILQRQHSNFDNRRQISDDNLEGTDGILNAVRSEQAAAEAELIDDWETLHDTEDEPLPPGWEVQLNQGRLTYVNRRRGLSQLQRPTSGVEESSSDSAEDLSVYVTNAEQGELFLGRESQHANVRIARSPSVPSAPAAPQTLHVEEEMDSRTPEPESPLPAGWTKGKVPETGQVFYIDHNSRTTSWTKPKVRTDGLYATLGPLPNGWEMRNTRQGRPFFINHRTKETTWQDPRQQDALPDSWEMRVHVDGRVFYVDHSTKSTQWEDPRTTKVSSGPAIQYSRDYKVKYENFKANLPKPANSSGKCDITVKRTNILEDSFNCLESKTKDEMLRRLWITFEGEPGLDYGGVAREWFYLLSREMFNPYYGLFEYSAIDNYTLQINPNSELCNPDHERFFTFFGRICALAVYHGKLVDGFFIRPFYKMMLGKSIVLEDMAEVDIETYNSLKWVIENDPGDLCLTFSAQEDKFGEIIETALVTNGEDIEVTEFNKMGYISAYIRWKFVDRISKQMSCFTRGFADVIPISKLAVFDENELEYLMCGITQIDVNDWKEYSEYKGGYSPSHHVVVWFWKAIYSFDNEFRARLLQFVTGTSRVPMNGFRELQGSNGDQRFCIEKWGSPNDLPRAHTCFNRIDLPPYKDYHTLREKVRIAVECTGGFDID